MQWPPLWKDLPVQADDGDDASSSLPSHLQIVLLRTSAIRKKDEGGSGGREVGRGSQWVLEPGPLHLRGKNPCLLSSFFLYWPSGCQLEGEEERPLGGGFRERNHLPSSVAWNIFFISHTSPLASTHIKFGLCSTSQSSFATFLLWNTYDYYFIRFNDSSVIWEQIMIAIGREVRCLAQDPVFGHCSP